MKKRNLTWLDHPLLFIGAGMILYVAVYFVVARRAVTRTVARGWASSANATVFTPQPDYRGLPARIFEPIHQLDRRFVRRKTWASWRVPLWDASVNDPLNPQR